MRARVACAVAIVALLSACGQGADSLVYAGHPSTAAGPPNSFEHAYVAATLRSPSGDARGVVAFAGVAGDSVVQVNLTGLTPGWHGLHLRAGGDCAVADTAEHLDDSGAAHGAHVGDLPPVLVGADGVAELAFAVDFALGYDVVSRGEAMAVVTGRPDNLGHVPGRYIGPDGAGPDRVTLGTGDAAGVAACGTIRSEYVHAVSQLRSSSGERAVLRDSAGLARGTAAIAPDGVGGVGVTIRADGLSPGFHGLHVLGDGTCGPGHAHLAGPDAAHGHHAGDLPALFVQSNGTARMTFRTDAFGLDTLFDADGAAFVVHEQSDNFAHIPDRYSSIDQPDVRGPDAATRATGDSGAVALCGAVEHLGDPAVVRLTADVPVITAGNSPTLHVVVTDAAGRPLPDALVLFSTDPGAEAYGHFAALYTDATGRGSLTVRPLVTTTYVARAGSAADSSVVAVQERVTVDHPRPGAVQGQPVTFTGRLGVVWTLEPDPRYAGRPVGLAMYVVTGGVRRWVYLTQTKTDQNGVFSLTRALPRGTATYVVYTPAFGGTRRGSTSLTLTVP